MKNQCFYNNVLSYKPLLSLSVVALLMLIQPITLSATNSNKPLIDSIKHTQQLSDAEPIDNAYATIPATYKKGMPAFYAFISENIVYPKSLVNENIQGAVVVRFVVDTKGKVSDVWVIKSVHPEMDKEAMRVIKMLGKFTPAKLKGKKIPVYFTLPIKFRIGDSKK